MICSYNAASPILSPARTTVGLSCPRSNSLDRNAQTSGWRAQITCQTRRLRLFPDISRLQRNIEYSTISPTDMDNECVGIWMAIT